MGQELEDLNAKVDELSTKADTLQATVDADQASDAAVVVNLKEQIATLEAQIANGATPEQLTAVKDKIVEAIAKIESTTADAASENNGQ